MGIYDLRKQLKGQVPGVERLIMQYEEGGRVHVFSIDKVSVRLGPGSTAANIKEAFLKAAGEP